LNEIAPPRQLHRYAANHCFLTVMWEWESSPLQRPVVRYISVAAVLLLLLVPTFFLFRRAERNNKALPQLRALMQETPVYFQFRQTKATEYPGINRASIVVTYNVPAYTVNFEDVKSFYMREMTSRGWQQQPYRRKPLIDLGGDRDGHVTFSKGNYWITVEPNDGTTNYLVEYRWEGAF